MIIRYEKTDIDKHKGFIYCLQCEQTGNLKIGFTRNLLNRVARLQAISPTRLKILAIDSGGRSEEAWIHRHFKDDRLHGEWFNSSPDLLSLVNGYTEAVIPLVEVRFIEFLEDGQRHYYYKILQDSNVHEAAMIVRDWFSRYEYKEMARRLHDYCFFKFGDAYLREIPFNIAN